MNIYQLIKQDHDLQRELAAEIMETSGNSDERHELWNQFKSEALSHANAEEQTLYAKLIEIPEAQDQARHSVAEHKETNDLIEEIDNTDYSSSGWIQKFEKLKDEIEHHLDEEEADVFELGQKFLSENESEQIGERFEERKEEELEDVVAVS